MKKFVIAVLLLVSCVSVYSQSDSITRNGNTFSVVRSSRVKEEPIITSYFYEDSKGEKHPIFVSKATGACFIVKISKKTGKEYRQYLGEKVSTEICKELGIEYKPKK